jgi:WD40 repeat protein
VGEIRRLRTVVGTFFCVLVAIGTLVAQNVPAKRDNKSAPALPKPGLIQAVGISADGKFAFSGDSERVIRVWDVQRRELTRLIQDQSFHCKTIPCYDFSSDGSFALVGNGLLMGFPEPAARLDRDTLTLWHLKTGVRLGSFETRGESVHAVALSPDAKWAASVSVHKAVINLEKPLASQILMAVRLWDTSNGKLVRTFYDENTCSPVAFSRDGKFVASAPSAEKLSDGEGLRNDVKIFDTHTGRATKSMAFQNIGISAIAFSLDGKFLATGSGSSVCMWELATAELVWKFNCQQKTDGAPIDSFPIQAIRFSRDGKRIVASGGYGGIFEIPRGVAKGGLVILDAVSGKKTPTFRGTKEWVRSVCFTPDGRMLLGATAQGVRFWDAQTGNTIFTLKN